MKQEGLNVIDSMKELVKRYEMMDEFLRDLWACGDAYNPDKEKLMDFLNKGEHPWKSFNPSYDGQTPPRGWEQLREIVMPDFDDSE